MKRFALFAAMLLAVASCTPDLDENQTPEIPVKQAKVVFHATFTDPSAPTTKVFLNDGWKLRWNESDELSIFNKNVQNQKFVATIKDSGASADFTPASGDGVGSGSAVSSIYALYPYQADASISTAGALSLTIPAEQSYYGGNSFGQGANVMVSVTNDENLVFKNACGYLELKLYGSNVNVTRVSLTGKNHEKLAGAATVTVDANGIPAVSMSTTATETVEMVCTNPVTLGTSSTGYTSFVLVVPPTTFSQGFTITVEDNQGGVFAKMTTKSVTIDRNKVISMAPIEVVPYKPFWGVVGAFNNWGGPDEDPTDLGMEETSSGVWVSPAFKVPKGFASGDGFKVRKDYVWTKVNYGGEFNGFNNRFDVYRDGPNIQLSESQDYQVVVTLYDDGTGNPQINVEQVDVWSVIGYFNGWAGDVEMTETSAGSGIWVSPVFDSHPGNGSGNDGFKLRKNYKWGDQFGDQYGASSFPGFNTAFSADGNVTSSNVIVDPSKLNHRISVKLDLSLPTSPKITVFEHPVWSVMGDFNDWTADLDMEESSPNSGIWESAVFETGRVNNPSNYGFKLRKDHDWVMQYGIASDSSFPGFDTPFVGVSSANLNKNIVVGDYTYQNYRVSVTLDLSQNPPTITVHDQNIWRVSGSFNGWGKTGDDIDLHKTGPYQWSGELTDIPAGTTFKLFKNLNWQYNWGAFNQQTTIIPGTPLSLESDGKNILITEAGTYEVVLNLENTMTVTVTKVQQP